MTHKTILIETVENGWVVHPFTPDPHWYHNIANPTYVFRDMKELCEKLPTILDQLKPPVLTTSEVLEQTHYP